jgi:hypothetical protein
MVVLPVGLAVWTGAYLHRIELQGVWFEADARLARTAIRLVEWEMAEARPALEQGLGPWEDGPQSEFARRAASVGGTVLLLEPGDEALEAALFTRGPGGELLTARADVGGPVTQTMAQAAGYEVALYLDGSREAVTDPGFGPEHLDQGTTRRARILLFGVPLRLADGRQAALVPRAAPRQGDTHLIALTAPASPRRRPLTRPFALLALGLIGGLLLLRTATWNGPLEPKTAAGKRWVDRALGVVPVAIAMAAILNVAARFNDDVTRYTEDTLARELAIARTLGPEAPAASIRRVTGYHATRLVTGEVVASTLPPGPLRDRVRDLEIPENGGAVTGRIGVGETTLAFAAGQTETGTTLVLSHRPDESAIREFTYRLGGLGLLLLVLVLLFPAYEKRLDSM